MVPPLSLGFHQRAWNTVDTQEMFITLILFSRPLERENLVACQARPKALVYFNSLTPYSNPRRVVLLMSPIYRREN